MAHYNAESAWGYMKKYKSNKKTFHRTYSMNTCPTGDGIKSMKRISGYYPLFVLISIIFGVSLILSLRSNGGTMSFMNSFMAGFFISFSFFKILDVRGFANSYIRYDIIASKSVFYAYTYPFIELGLGLLYVSGIYPKIVNSITAGIMLIGLFGIINAIAKRKKLNCACMGTIINLPLSVVSVLENTIMIIMAVVKLFLA